MLWYLQRLWKHGVMRWIQRRPLAERLLVDHTQRQLKRLSRLKISKKSADRLPIYVVIGPPRVGKTTLLEQSGLHFLDTQSFLDHSHGTEGVHTYSHWWITEEAVFIDTPGNYWETPSYLQALLKTLPTYAGVLWCFNATALAEQGPSAATHALEGFKSALDVLLQIPSRSVVWYALWTHVDRLAGFTACFGGVGGEVRAAPLGIRIPFEARLQQKVLSLLEQEWGMLINRLHHYVLHRLPQLSVLTDRGNVHEFPLQLSYLHDRLWRYLGPIAHMCEHEAGLTFAGLYFTAYAKGSDYPVDSFAPILTTAFNVPYQETRHVVVPAFAYFTRRLLRKVIPDSAQAWTTLRQRTKWVEGRRWLFPVGCLLLMSTLVWCTYSYITFRHQIGLAEQAVASYTRALTHIRSVGMNPQTALTLLNAAQLEIHQLSKVRWPLLLRIGSDTSHPAARAQRQYEEALQNVFWPTLMMGIRSELLNTSVAPEIRYAALSSYLQLMHLMPMDRTHLNFYVSGYVQRAGLSSHETLMWQKHLANALIHPIMMTPDMAAVTAARTQLLTLPPATLSYIILCANDPGMLPNPLRTLSLSDTHVFNLSVSMQQIPVVMTQTYFVRVYPTAFWKAVNAVMHGNAVLGPIATPVNQTWLAQQLHTIYLTRYNQYAQQLAASVSLKSPKTIAEAVSLARYLGSLASPLPKMYATLVTLQTNEGSVHPVLLPEQWATVTRLFNQTADTFATYSEHPSLALAFTKQRMAMEGISTDILSTLRDTARTLPQPLGLWMQQLQHDIWRLLLAQSLQLLNDSWSRTIVTYFDRGLAHRYPLAHNQAEISLTDFGRFFGPKGLLAEYVRLHLVPFIDTSAPRWQLRWVDGESLPITPAVLLQLERAQVIRQMFFGNSDAPHAEFTLTPMAFEGVINVRMVIGSQQLNDNTPDAEYHWTLPAVSASATLTAGDGRQIVYNFEGVWGWLRLLSEAHIAQTRDTQHFEFTLGAPPMVARYSITSPQVLNPFIPGVLEHFVCPPRLSA